jgi:hypothetical protein
VADNDNRNMNGPFPEQPQGLDVLELTLGAVKHLWSLRGPHSILALIVVLPYAVMGATGILDPFYTLATADNLPDGYFTAAGLMLAWAALWNTPAMVLWYRMFLLGPDHMLKLPAGAFLERALRLLGASALFGLILGGVTVVVMLIAAIATGGQGFNQGVLMAVILIAALIIGARLCLTFASITLGHAMPFRASWDKTKGRGLTIAGAFLLCALVAALLSVAVHGVIVAGLFGPPPTDGTTLVSSRWMYLVDLVLAPVSYAGSALVCAVTAAVFWRLLGRPANVVDIEV